MLYASKECTLILDFPGAPDNTLCPDTYSSLISDLSSCAKVRGRLDNRKICSMLIQPITRQTRDKLMIARKYCTAK